MEEFVQHISEEFKNIFFIKGANNGRYPFSHSLLIDDFLIDTGISSRLLRKLKRNFQLKNVLLSHWHEDHISGNRLLPSAEFYIHTNDKILVQNVDRFDEAYGVLNTSAANEFEWLMNSLKLIDTKIERTFEDKEIISVGDDYQLEIIHTPGHTAGHCAFIELNTKIAFLADIDLTKFVFYAGNDSNLIEFEESIEKLKQFDIEIAVTGHRGVIRGDKNVKKELDDYKLIIHKRDERILSYLSDSKPFFLDDLKGKNIIYKYYSEFKQYEIIAELIMIQKHFDKFLEEDLVISKNNGYILN